MKLFIASDLHGSAKYCRLMLEAANSEKADKLILLGDVLYHGPRNELPEEYSTQECAKMLTEHKQHIICVRGNCDAEVDESVLPFPLPDYALVHTDGINIYLSHGHRQVPPLQPGDVYITGHTHVPAAADEGFLHLNPGSVSLPKEGSERGYIVYEKGTFSFKTFEGKVFRQIAVENEKK